MHALKSQNSLKLFTVSIVNEVKISGTSIFVLEEVQPLKSRGDGTYLYRAVSIAISGLKEYYIKLNTLDYSFHP